MNSVLKYGHSLTRVLPWVILFAVRAFSVEIVDERINLLRQGSKGPGASVVFSGTTGIIDRTTILGPQGNLLFKGTENILDARSVGQTDFVLSTGSLSIRQNKKVQLFPTNGNYTSGKLLFARPTFWIYYVVDQSGTYFFTQTLTYRRLYYVVPETIVCGRVDKYGNTIIADKHKVVAVNTRSLPVPLFRFNDEEVTGFELLPSDNAILLSTNRGLFKLTQGRKLYTLLIGSGLIEKVNDEYFWTESNGNRHLVAGLSEVGNLESDTQYVKSLLVQAKMLMSLGAREKALQKYVKALEIMPSDEKLKRLIQGLAKQLYPNRKVKP